MSNFDLVKKYIKEKVGKEVTMNTTFNELGLDSLDLLDFVIDIEKELKIKFSDAELLNIKSVEDIVKQLNTKIS